MCGGCTAGGFNLYTAVLLVDYQVEWSTTATTEDGRRAAINEYALWEYRAEPEDYPDVSEADVEERPDDFIDLIGTLVTVETVLSGHRCIYCGGLDEPADDGYCSTACREDAYEAEGTGITDDSFVAQ